VPAAFCRGRFHEDGYRKRVVGCVAARGLINFPPPVFADERASVSKGAKPGYHGRQFVAARMC
jgi:hypothetical protein